MAITVVEIKPYKKVRVLSPTTRPIEHYRVALTIPARSVSQSEEILGTLGLCIQLTLRFYAHGTCYRGIQAR